MLGYTSWHQLLVYSCNSCLISSFMLLCSYPSVVCLSCYLVILWLQFILLLFCAHCWYARAFPFTHTHSPGRFLTTLDLYVQILDACFYCSGVRWDRTLREELELPPIPFWYSYLSCLHIIFWFSLYQIQLLFQFFIYMISCVDAYMWHCSNHDSLQLGFIPCFGLLRLSVYTWGIFLAYMRRRLVSRLRSSVFWEAGRDILWSLHPKGVNRR